jgi:branched-chain amino acid transport system ATP-binding protein
VLAVEDLTVSYGAVRALDGVSFEAQPACITAVLGANGAGKTTLLRTISGLVRPLRGRVRFGEMSLTGMAVERVVRSGVAHVPEGSGVVAELSVEQNLRLGMWRTRGPAARRAAQDEAYELFPLLRQRRRAHGADLSGGERRMLAIAMALTSKPKALLLDEPSLGLAPRATAELTATLRDLAVATGIAVVLVEQNVRSALSVARTAVVLNLGRVVMTGSAAEVGADPELRRRYLGF